MSEPLAIEASGQALTAFHRDPEITGSMHRGLPCPLALVVLDAEGGILLGLNRWRGSWELPGGLLEEGETPRQAAARELLEETGVDLPEDQLRWAGLAEFALVDPTRIELAAVFVARSERRPAVQSSEELTEVGWFRPGHPPEPHSPLDLAIAEIALEDERG